MGCQVEQFSTKFKMSFENYEKAYKPIKQLCLEECSNDYDRGLIKKSVDLNSLMIAIGWKLKIATPKVDLESINTTVINVANDLVTLKKLGINYTKSDNDKSLDSAIKKLRKVSASLLGDNTQYVTDIKNKSGYLNYSFELFEALAPFVEDGSYIEMSAEGDENWRFSFENGKMIERKKLEVWK